MKISLIILMLLLPLLLSCEQRITDANVIVPGQGLGRFAIGKSTMAQILGEDTALARKKYAAQGIHFQFDRGKALTGITISDSKYQTNKGIRVGDSVKQVTSAYGASKIQKMTEAHGKFTLDALVYKGIAFIVVDGSVSAIFVGDLSR